MTNPLADRIRPESLEQVVGQQHLLGPGKALRQLIESGDIPNLIFYGPPGVGKTTVASIIAKRTDRALRRLNGTNASTAGTGGRAGHPVRAQRHFVVFGRDPVF